MKITFEISDDLVQKNESTTAYLFSGRKIPGKLRDVETSLADKAKQLLSDHINFWYDETEANKQGKTYLKF